VRLIMAENKKSFVLYSDLLPTIKKLIEKDREKSTNNTGELFYHILMYVSDLNPEAINDTVDLVFEPIKTQLKRDLIKWEQRSERSRENGQKGGRPKNLEKPNETQQVILEPKKPDSVNVSDSVNVNDNVILLKKETKERVNCSDDFLIVWNEYKKYRVGKRKSFKFAGLKYEQMAFDKFYKLSNGKIEIAKKILQQSLDNNWDGLFELKETIKTQNNERVITKNR